MLIIQMLFINRNNIMLMGNKCFKGQIIGFMIGVKVGIKVKIGIKIEVDPKGK